MDVVVPSILLATTLYTFSTKQIKAFILEALKRRNELGTDASNIDQKISKSTIRLIKRTFPKEIQAACFKTIQLVAILGNSAAEALKSS